MTSDEERRDVAERLRELAKSWCGDDDVRSDVRECDVVHACGLEYGFYDDCVTPGSVRHFADLVDRPTCRNTSERDGKFESDVFTCSECGNEINVWDGSGGWVEVRYCPFCGRRVVRDE